MNAAKEMQESSNLPSQVCDYNILNTPAVIW